MGMNGYIKEGLELTPMGSFNFGQGRCQLHSYRVPDGVQTDGPGFSLCAVPLELSGPGFQDGRVHGMKERRSGVYRTRDGRGNYSKGS